MVNGLVLCDTDEAGPLYITWGFFSTGRSCFAANFCIDHAGYVCNTAHALQGFVKLSAMMEMRQYPVFVSEEWAHVLVMTKMYPSIVHTHMHARIHTHFPLSFHNNHMHTCGA